jgi:hypothetical protein
MTKGTKWSRRLLGSVLIGIASLYLGLQAQIRAASLTPAGTEIRNQSVATYKDANDQPQISTSNEVINIVDKVFALEILPDKTGGTDAPFNYTDTPALTQTTAPGNVAYYHYYLTNKGNTQDTYDLTTAFQAAAGTVIAPNGIEVYFDANGNGLVDAGDILLATDGGNVTATPIVAQDATIPLIVAVKTPTNATDAQVINTDLQGSSNGGTATDAISNWNQTKFSRSTGILTATKSADVSSAIPGQTLTYTIEGSNTGSADVYAVDYPALINLGAGAIAQQREGILIVDELDKDKLDPGAKYANIANATVLGPTKARIVYWDETNSIWQINPANATWTSKPMIALFIPDADSVVANAAGDGNIGPVLTPGQGYKFSFEIDIVAPYPVDQAQVIENQVKATYSKNAAGDPVDTESNKSLVTIGDDPLTATPGAAIGPFKQPMADNTAALELKTVDHPAIDSKGLSSAAKSDITSAGERDAGEVIAFPLTILNPNEVLPDGDKLGVGGPATLADTYNITVSNPDPSSFNVVLYKSDGTTPLADTNGDGKPDTGAINPDGTANIVVKVFIKADADVAAASTFTVTATSTNVGTPADTTKLLIEKVLPAGVDIATTGQLGKSDNDTIAAYDADSAVNDAAMKLDDAKEVGVVPGDVILFPIDIANMRPGTHPTTDPDTTTTVADTYKLSYTKINDATDATPFTVQLYKGDGAGAIAGLVQISDTGWLAASTVVVPAASIDNIFNLIARVQVPMGTPKGDYFIKVTATSSNNPAISDDMHLLVRVIDAPGIEVTPDNTATVIAGGTYTFRHVVTNTGNVADTVTLKHSADLPNGYSAVWVDCADGTVFATATGLGTNASPSTWQSGSIAVGASIDVCLKVFVPANAASGSVVPITVTGQMDNYAPSDTALDIITVIDGALQLIKSNNPTGDVPPAGTITYTTAYKNLSAGVLTTAVIADAIPANTTLTNSTVAGTLPNGTAAPATAFQYSKDNGVNWIAWDPATTDKVTNIRLNVGSVPAGEGGTLVFAVTVD